MNDVVLALDRFKNNKIYYGDTDSVYIHKNEYDILKDKGLVGKNLFQSKDDYGENAGILYAMFLAPKVKYCIVIKEFGVLSQKPLPKAITKTIII